MTEAEVIEKRLENGWALIEKTKDPVQAQRLTDHFISLLHQYETAVGLEWCYPEHHERIAERSAA